jgi:hypothetical protein
MEAAVLANLTPPHCLAAAKRHLSGEHKPRLVRTCHAPGPVTQRPVDRVNFPSREGGSPMHPRAPSATRYIGVLSGMSRGYERPR